MQEFDVIICGAGPAGTTTALGLFDAGLNVALLDKQTFPREKICGDAYGGYAYKILNTISPEFGKKLLALNEGVIAKRAKFISPKGHVVELKLKGFFANLPRHRFDDFLLNMVREETNTSVFQNTGAQKITIEKDHVLVATDDNRLLKAKLIIGCDGAHSVVQTALTGTRTLTTESCPGLRAYYKNVKGVETDCLEIHLLSEIPKGYFWIFPSTDGNTNVGIGADKDVLVKHKINLRKQFLDIMQQVTPFKERFAEAELVGEIKGWTIPLGYFNSKLPISGHRVMLCGDAAALVDPATGEGIGPAMSSGRFAARQIKQCFSENNFSGDFIKAYDRQIRKKYFRNYFLKSSVTSLYYNFPFLMDWAVYIVSGFNKTSGRLQHISKTGLHKTLSIFIALVWFINGFFCKVLNLVPRHELIVSRLLGTEHAVWFTKIIGVLEIAMAAWIISRIHSRLNAIMQITIVATMNILEFILVPDILLWGRANIFFAFILVMTIYYNEFQLNKTSVPRHA